MAAPSFAQTEAGGADPSADLFREGRQLVNEGRFAEACERFRASLALRRSAGTLLNVGNCLESEGKLLAAHEIFDEVLKLAAAEPDARKALVWTAAARDEVAALDERIPRLTVTSKDATVSVTLDGQPLTTLGEPLRLDPGNHRLEASAEGKQRFERDIELSAGASASVEVPELAPLVVSEPAPVSPQPVSVAGSATGLGEQPTAAFETSVPASDALSAEPGASRVWPWVVIGMGGAAFIGGAVTGIVAVQSLKNECPNETCERDLSPVDRAEDAAIVGDVLMLTGLLTAGAGTAWLLMTDADGAGAAVAAACSSSGCEARLHGRF